MKVMPGEKLFDVADYSHVWIVADIYEYELSAVHVGQLVKITLSYFPGREWTSRIDYIYPVFSAETRTAKVRLTLPNPGGQLKPQMFTMWKSGLTWEASSRFLIRPSLIRGRAGGLCGSGQWYF